MPDKIFIGQKASTIEKGAKLAPTSGVRMVVDDNTEVVGGSTSGYVWEVESPWATQEQADWLASQMSGYEYQPYSASAFELDPAAEMGDYVTVGGVFGGIFTDNITFGSMLYDDVAAPMTEDIDHEFPFEPESQRRFTRLAKQMAAEFRIQADEIAAKVSAVGGDNNSFGWSMTVDGMRWYANGQEIMSASQAGLTVVSNIRGGTIQIGSNFSVDEYGNMTATSATLSGTLTVGGSQITAGTLRSGANSGYQWANGSYGGTSPWQYSLTGSGYGFNFNAASNSYVNGPDVFTVGQIGVRGTGAYYYFSHGVVITVNGVSYTVLGFRNE